MPFPATPSRSRSAVFAFGAIVVTTLIAGTLKLLGAFAVHGYVLGNTPPGRILQATARGVFGNAAFTGGGAKAYWGLGLHYLVTLLFTLFYFAWYPYVPYLHKYWVRSGLLYGIFVWGMMNLVVLPFSRAGAPARNLQAVAWGTALVVAFVGLPIARAAHRFFRR